MTVLRNIVLGVLFTLLLLGFLAVTRLLFLKVEPHEMVLTQLQTITLAPPPEPPSVQPEQENAPDESIAPPSPPALADLRPSVDVARLTMPNMDQSVALDLSVDLFSIEAQPLQQPAVAPKQNKVPTAVRRPSQPVRLAGATGISDLDGKPSVLRQGRFHWPSRIRSEVVKAVVKVELSAKGGVKLLEIKSVSDESIRSVLPAFVNGSKFTIPKKDGKPVEVIFYWPLILKKP